MHPSANPSPGPRHLVSLRRLFPFLAPAVGIACFLALYLLDDRRSSWRDARIADESEPEICEFPHGRVLYVIVEPEGVYIGEERISFENFPDYLKTRKRTLSPDFFIIAGTDTARYGDVVSVFGTLRATFRAGYMLETRSLPLGTRRPRIRVAENYWDY